MNNKRIAEGVSLDVNPSSRQVLENLIRDGHILTFVRAGARIHQPANSTAQLPWPLRREGRQGLPGQPRNGGGVRTRRRNQRSKIFEPSLSGDLHPAKPIVDKELLLAPAPDSSQIALEKGPNIVSLPELEPLPDELVLPVLLKVGDDISTDEILPAGSRVLPYRSNIPRISEFVFEAIDASYARRADDERHGHCLLGGANYGQGSSREHAALAPRFLGLRVVLAKSFSRIHRANPINFGVLPLEIEPEDQYHEIEPGDTLLIADLHSQIRDGETVQAINLKRNRRITTRNRLSAREEDLLLAGGVINTIKARRKESVAAAAQLAQADVSRSGNRSAASDSSRPGGSDCFDE